MKIVLNCFEVADSVIGTSLMDDVLSRHDENSSPDVCRVSSTRGFKLQLSERWQKSDEDDAILARAANILLERDSG